MDGLLQQVRTWITTALGKGTGAAVVASTVTYAIGYLALRFKLTALGLGTDLEVLDERYMFEGIRCLIYFAAAVPIAFVATMVIGWPIRAVARRSSALRTRAARWWEHGTGPLACGIVLSLLTIQLVMRQGFQFDNLLLRTSVPEPRWMLALLAAPADERLTLYFAALLGLVALTAAPLVGLGSWGGLSRQKRMLGVTLLALVSAQCALLPVNYGVLMAGRALPRVVHLTPSAFDEREQAWLIWEGKLGTTLLVEGAGEPRLVTLRGAELERLDIAGFDSLAEIVSKRADQQAGSQSLAGALTSFVSGGAHAAERDDSSWTLSSAWRQVARISGFSAMPTALRDAGPLSGKPVRGDLELLPFDGDAPAQPLTGSGDLSSPVFLPSDLALLALRGELLVRCDLSRRGEVEVARLPGAVRLLGTPSDGTSQLYYVASSDSRRVLRRLDLHTLEDSAVDASLSDEELLYALGDRRDHGETLLDVRDCSSQLADCTEVVVQLPGAPLRSLSANIAGHCRQPTLSHDGKLVVYVRVR